MESRTRSKFLAANDVELVNLPGRGTSSQDRGDYLHANVDLSNLRTATLRAYLRGWKPDVDVRLSVPKSRVG
jgi:hypothetical protein